MKKTFLIILYLTIICFITEAQAPVYFNNIYQKQNNFAIGMTILETDDGYVGYGGTEDPSNIGQMILFYKINNQGEETIWKPFGENYHSYYYGNVGGAMINTNDGNFAMTCHYGFRNEAYGTLLKLNNNLDTIWQKSYHPAYKTITVNCISTVDNGFLLAGWVWESESDVGNSLLIKVDSNGTYQWHNTYGGTLAELGSNVIETGDGYLLGGFITNPSVYHSLDAMLIKTDSLGNEEWTHYYGNPDVDDDMALVTLADDGNYLVATVYGDKIFAPEARSGRIYILEVNNEGTILSEIKIGPNRLNLFIKNLRKINDGYVLTGFSKETDSATYQYYSGWMMKLDNNFDSVWFRDYIHEDENWESYFYDACPTSDNGYIAIGKAHPDGGGQTNKMWIVKTDSLGCDTPGCFTTAIPELSPSMRGQGEELKIWPNPAKRQVTLRLSKCEEGKGLAKGIIIYNSQGLKVEEIKVPDGVESLQVDVSKYTNGLYYLQFIHSNQIIETVKFIKN